MDRIKESPPGALRSWTWEDERPPDQAIREARGKIDEIDRQMVELLNRRAEQALLIGRGKKDNGWAGFSPEREQEVFDSIQAASQGPLPESSLVSIFAEIISACRKLQAPLRVAYLGPEATFCHQAALARLGHSCDFSPQRSIIEVFEEVEKGRSQIGVVPVENSSEGMVNVTLDRFDRTDLLVCGEIYLPVAHCLMSLENSMARVTRIYSHPQALNQCRRWLSLHLPLAAMVEVESTAAAAREAAGQPGGAAVGSELAAAWYKLPILARDIQDVPQNTTRFLLIGRLRCRPTGRDKTSILFRVKHRPGTLYAALRSLAERGVNLTRIESRPIKNRPWEYSFFVELEGHLQEEDLGRAMAELEKEVESLKILGSYPMADHAGPGRISFRLPTIQPNKASLGATHG